MTDPWQAATWDGARRAQIERSLTLSVRERLRGLEGLAEASGAIVRAGAQARPESRGSEIVLDGLGPVPLASYLCALGVFRLVAEGPDPAARGAWSEERFVLRTRLDREALLRFFLRDYRPTPILAPWNGGSGFYPKDSTSAIEALEAGEAERFSTLRETIRLIRSVLEHRGLEEKPGAAAKEALLVHLRAELGDEALPWLDAAVLLTDESPRYPPLLGTGGNDGRLEFTNNFLQRVVELFDPATGEPADATRSLLEAVLFDRPSPELRRSAVGQFDPSGAGGPNAASAFEGGSLVNPWSFVLMLEGSVLFAVTATRRLESSAPRALSYPFTVHATGAGSGSAHLADEGDSRGEIWVSLWQRPVTIAELRALMGEGRATVGRRPARDGLDFARAVARLGVARGVRAFQRYAFLQRYGRTFLATPLERVPVRADTRAELIDDLERRFDWLGRFRRMAREREAPARLTSLGRRLDDALFRLTEAESGAQAAAAPQKALIVLGQIMRYLAASPSAREHCPPVPLLRPEWVDTAYDGSAEFRVAAALAGLHGRSGEGRGPARSWPVIEHIAPVAADNRWAWSDGAAPDVVWGQRPLAGNLAFVLERRLQSARSRAPRPGGEMGGDPSASKGGYPLRAVLDVPGADIAAFLGGALDLRRVEALFLGLALTRLPRSLPGGEPSGGARGPNVFPAAYRILKPLFTPREELVEIGFLTGGERLPLPASVVRQLRSGRVGGALREATVRLAASGIAVPDHVLPRGGALSGVPDGPDLLAALILPISTTDLRVLLRPFRQPRRDGAPDPDPSTKE